MIILGIDPGVTRIGYGVIRQLANKKLEFIDCGVIEGGPNQKLTELIDKNIKKISGLIIKYKPEIIGIEKIYFVKNVKTGIAVAQMRGAIISEITKYTISIKEFNPSEIKLAVANYGLADKKAVSKMVSRILNIEKIAGFDDVSDALAIAITAAVR
jgi:crossover junction endodeoxyribonuclease RuvC